MRKVIYYISLYLLLAPSMLMAQTMQVRVNIDSLYLAHHDEKDHGNEGKETNEYRFHFKVDLLKKVGNTESVVLEGFDLYFGDGSDYKRYDNGGEGGFWEDFGKIFKINGNWYEYDNSIIDRIYPYVEGAEYKLRIKFQSWETDGGIRNNDDDFCDDFITGIEYPLKNIGCGNLPQSEWFVSGCYGANHQTNPYISELDICEHNPNYKGFYKLNISYHVNQSNLLSDTTYCQSDLQQGKNLTDELNHYIDGYDGTVNVRDVYQEQDVEIDVRSTRVGVENFLDTRTPSFYSFRRFLYWTQIDGNGAHIEVNPVITAPGEYYLNTGYTSTEGDHIETRQKVTIHMQPNPSTAHINGTYSLCAGSSVVVNADYTPVYDDDLVSTEYIWKDPTGKCIGLESSYEFTTEGDGYSVEIIEHFLDATNGNKPYNCSSIRDFDINSIPQFVIQMPSYVYLTETEVNGNVSHEATLYAGICPVGQSCSPNGTTEGYTFQWSHEPNTGHSTTVNAPGIYQVTATENIFGCSAFGQVEVLAPNQQNFDKIQPASWSVRIQNKDTDGNNSVDFADGLSKSIADPNFSDYDTEGLLQQKALVKLNYHRSELSDIIGADQWILNVPYSITIDGLTTDSELRISNVGAAPTYLAVDEYIFNIQTADLVTLTMGNATATAIDGSNIALDLLPEDIDLELEYQVMYLAPMGSFASGPTLTGISNENKLHISWMPIDGALEYELAIAFEDHYIIEKLLEDNEVISTLSGTTLNQFFKERGYTIETSDNNYTLDVTYPKGRIFIRIRAIGRHLVDVDGNYSYRKYSNWSATSDVIWSGFEETENWQKTITFAEDGKHKEVVSYFDDLMRSKEVVTHLSSDNTILRAHSFVDHEGRTVFQTLPFADKNSNGNLAMQYGTGSEYFIKTDPSNPNSAEEPLDKKHFDFGIQPQLMTNYGAAKYYSPLNDYLNDPRFPNSNFIPNADGYVSTQVEYLRDGSGRISRQSGVGEIFSLGDRNSTVLKPTRYFYGTPKQAELIRLFGSNVGDATHYKMNAVLDPNGQLSVSYLDMQDRVIATALAGDVPDNLVTLGNLGEPTTLNLYEKNHFYPDRNAFIISDEIINKNVATTYRFHYDIETMVNRLKFQFPGQEEVFDHQYTSTSNILDWEVTGGNLNVSSGFLYMEKTDINTPLLATLNIPLEPDQEYTLVVNGVNFSTGLVVTADYGGNNNNPLLENVDGTLAFTFNTLASQGNDGNTEITLKIADSDAVQGTVAKLDFVKLYEKEYIPILVDKLLFEEDLTLGSNSNIAKEWTGSDAIDGVFKQSDFPYVKFVNNKNTTTPDDNFEAILTFSGAQLVPGNYELFYNIKNFDRNANIQVAINNGNGFVAGVPINTLNREVIEISNGNSISIKWTASGLPLEEMEILTLNYIKLYRIDENNSPSLTSICENCEYSFKTYILDENGEQLDLTRVNGVAFSNPKQIEGIIKAGEIVVDCDAVETVSIGQNIFDLELGSLAFNTGNVIFNQDDPMPYPLMDACINCFYASFPLNPAATNNDNIVINNGIKFEFIDDIPNPILIDGGQIAINDEGTWEINENTKTAIQGYLNSNLDLQSSTFDAEVYNGFIYIYFKGLNPNVKSVTLSITDNSNIVPVPTASQPELIFDATFLYIGSYTIYKELVISAGGLEASLNDYKEDLEEGYIYDYLLEQMAETDLLELCNYSCNSLCLEELLITINTTFGFDSEHPDQLTMAELEDYIVNTTCPERFANCTIKNNGEVEGYIIENFPNQQLNISWSEWLANCEADCDPETIDEEELQEFTAIGCEALLDEMKTQLSSPDKFYFLDEVADYNNDFTAYASARNAFYFEWLHEKYTQLLDGQDAVALDIQTWINAIQAIDLNNPIYDFSNDAEIGKFIYENMDGVLDDNVQLDIIANNNLPDENAIPKYNSNGSTDWLSSFVIFHREYEHYTNCLKDVDGQAFVLKLISFNTWAAANGWLEGTAIVMDNLEIYDPIVQNILSGDRNKLLFEIENYFIDDANTCTTDPQSYSLHEAVDENGPFACVFYAPGNHISTLMNNVSCLSQIPGINADCGLNPAPNWTSYNFEELKIQKFVTLYSGIREKLKYETFNAEYFSDRFAIAYDPRFGNEAEAAAEQNDQAFYDDWCDNQCSANATVWVSNIKNYVSSNTCIDDYISLEQEADLFEFLYNLCVDGCSIENMDGLIVANYVNEIGNPVIPANDLTGNDVAIQTYLEGNIFPPSTQEFVPICDADIHLTGNTTPVTPGDIVSNVFVPVTIVLGDQEIEICEKNECYSNAIQHFWIDNGTVEDFMTQNPNCFSSINFQNNYLTLINSENCPIGDCITTYFWADKNGDQVNLQPIEYQNIYCNAVADPTEREVAFYHSGNYSLQLNIDHSEIEFTQQEMEDTYIKFSFDEQSIFQTELSNTVVPLAFQFNIEDPQTSPPFLLTYDFVTVLDGTPVNIEGKISENSICVSKLAPNSQYITNVQPNFQNPNPLVTSNTGIVPVYENYAASFNSIGGRQSNAQFRDGGGNTACANFDSGLLQAPSSLTSLVLTDLEVKINNTYYPIIVDQEYELMEKVGNNWEVNDSDPTNVIGYINNIIAAFFPNSTPSFVAKPSPQNNKLEVEILGVNEYAQIDHFRATFETFGSRFLDNDDNCGYIPSNVCFDCNYKFRLPLIGFSDYKLDEIKLANNISLGITNLPENLYLILNGTINNTVLNHINSQIQAQCVSCELTVSNSNINLIELQLTGAGGYENVSLIGERLRIAESTLLPFSITNNFKNCNLLFNCEEVTINPQPAIQWCDYESEFSSLAPFSLTGPIVKQIYDNDNQPLLNGTNYYALNEVSEGNVLPVSALNQELLNLFGSYPNQIITYSKAGNLVGSSDVCLPCNCLEKLITDGSLTQQQLQQIASYQFPNIDRPAECDECADAFTSLNLNYAQLCADISENEQNSTYKINVAGVPSNIGVSRIELYNSNNAESLNFSSTNKCTTVNTNSNCGNTCDYISEQTQEIVGNGLPFIKQINLPNGSPILPGYVNYYFNIFQDVSLNELSTYLQTYMGEPSIRVEVYEVGGSSQFKKQNNPLIELTPNDSSVFRMAGTVEDCNCYVGNFLLKDSQAVKIWSLESGNFGNIVTNSYPNIIDANHNVVDSVVALLELDLRNALELSDIEVDVTILENNAFFKIYNAPASLGNFKLNFINHYSSLYLINRNDCNICTEEPSNQRVSNDNCQICNDFLEDKGVAIDSTSSCAEVIDLCLKVNKILTARDASSGKTYTIKFFNIPEEYGENFQVSWGYLSDRNTNLEIINTVEASKIEGSCEPIQNCPTVNPKSQVYLYSISFNYLGEDCAVKKTCTTYHNPIDIIYDNECPNLDCVPTEPIIDEEQECLTSWLSNIEHLALEAFQEEWSDIKNLAISESINECAKVKENFYYQYINKEHHYTLYYYDQSGSLIQTVPPEGVKPLPPTDFASGIWVGTEQPKHNLITSYAYNSRNQVKWQKTPDAGESNFWYNKKGQLILSQNAKQIAENLYSFTTYDALGRIIWVGEIDRVGVRPLLDTDEDGIDEDEVTIAAFVAERYPNLALPSNPSAEVIFMALALQVVDFPFINDGFTLALQDLTHTVYDKNVFVPGLAQKNLRNRVSASYRFDEYSNYTAWKSGNNDNVNFTAYSYDEIGNVQTLMQHVGFASEEPTPTITFSEYKRIDYQYDLVSGNVNKVLYQRGEDDQFIHRYEYDSDNRITHVYTTRDEVIEQLDAEYFYYPHGPLARVELGEDKVQALDYYYTLQGWLKGVNGNEESDPGQDGIDMTALNGIIGRDEFAFQLGYFNQDYDNIASNAINGTDASWSDPLWTPSSTNANVSTHHLSNFNNVLEGHTDPNLIVPYNGLYNGNIGQMISYLPSMGADNTLTSHYQYDQLNRIKGAVGKIEELNRDPLFYQTAYNYDAMGNITNLYRAGVAETVTGLVYKDMDNLTYHYNFSTAPANIDRLKNNKLRHVNDGQTVVDAFTDDIDDQLGFIPGNNLTNDNYRYDEIGNLTKDDAEGIATIKWDVYGKITDIERSSNNNKANLSFKYDASGNRIMKIVKPQDALSDPSKWSYTFYFRDAQGNILSTEDHRPITSVTPGFDIAHEYNVYGSARVGTLKDIQPPLLEANASGEFMLTKTRKNYELTNHLGNVMAIVTDLKRRGQAFTDNFEFTPGSWQSTPLQGDNPEIYATAQNLDGGRYKLEVEYYDDPIEQDQTIFMFKDDYPFKPGRQYKLEAFVDLNGMSSGLIAAMDNNGPFAVDGYNAANADKWELIFTAPGIYDPLNPPIPILVAIGVDVSQAGDAIYVDEFSIYDITDDTELPYYADVKSAQDYYPFGMLLPNRTYNKIPNCEPVVTIDESAILINEEYSSDLGGWSMSNLSSSLDNGALKLTVPDNNESFAIANRVYSTIIGEEYTITFDVGGTSGLNGASLLVLHQNINIISGVPNYSDISSNNTNPFTFIEPLQYSFTFIANAELSSINLMMFGASNGSTFTIDNFKIIGAQQIRTFDCSGDNYLAINYRYGFNGKELDTETNTYDYGFRIYSGPLGKFLSVDPLYQSYPELTTYQFASNTPIWAVDLDGLEAEQHTYFYQIHEETGELQQVGFCNEIYTGVKRHGDKGALVDKYLWVVPEGGGSVVAKVISKGVYVPEPKPSVWEKVAKKVEDAVWNTNDYINEKMSWAKTLYIAVEGKGQAAASTTSPIGGVEGSGAVKSTSYVYASEGQGNQSENLGAASKLETETVVSLSTDKGKVASLSFKPGIFIGFSNQLKMSSKEGDVSTKSFTQIQVGPFIYKSNNGIGSDSKDVQIGGNFSLGLKYQTGAKVNQTIFTNDYSINPNNQESFNNDSCE